MISHLLNIVYGIVFGVANVIPGVSGGTMMVVFGVYDIAPYVAGEQMFAISYDLIAPYLNDYGKALIGLT